MFGFWIRVGVGGCVELWCVAGLKASREKSCWHDFSRKKSCLAPGEAGPAGWRRGMIFFAGPAGRGQGMIFFRMASRPGDNTGFFSRPGAKSLRLPAGILKDLSPAWPSLASWRQGRILFSRWAKKVSCLVSIEAGPAGRRQDISFFAGPRKILQTRQDSRLRKNHVLCETNDVLS